jgi:ribonuclease HI
VCPKGSFLPGLTVRTLNFRQVWLKIHRPFDPRLRSGDPATEVDLVPECEIILKGSERANVDERWIQIRADASYFPGRKVAGTAYSIEFQGKTSTPAKSPAVRGKGPIHSELLAVVRALRSCRKLGGQRVKVFSDNMVVLKFLCRFIRPRRPEFVSLVEEAISLLDLYSDVRVGHIRTSGMRRVDRRARSAAESASARKGITLARRHERLERRAQASASVRLSHSHDRWIAAGRFLVSVDPMSCDCPDWGARWSRVPIEGRRKNRVPCKHILRLGHDLGIPLERLDQLAKFAPA